MYQCKNKSIYYNINKYEDDIKGEEGRDIGEGIQFDPKLVEEFIRILEEE